jgi:hypothetical protein
MSSHWRKLDHIAFLLVACFLTVSLLLNVYVLIENEKLLSTLSSIQEENQTWYDFFMRQKPIIQFGADGKWHYWTAVKENGSLVIHHWIGEVLENGTILWYEKNG